MYTYLSKDNKVAEARLQLYVEQQTSRTWSTERLEKFPSDMVQTLRDEAGESGVQSADVVAEASGVLADAAAAAVNNPARTMLLLGRWREWWCLRNAREGRASRRTPSLSQFRGIQRGGGV